MDGYGRNNRGLFLLIVVVGLFGLSGASCPQTRPEPRILPPRPTLSQVIQAVNNNNSRIQSFSTTQASLSVPGIPSLRANLAFERPRRFRLRADLLGSPELDLGSNESQFWFWVKRNEQPAVYFCAHDQFATSPARQMVPVDPTWLIEALGVVELDPAAVHDGPIMQPRDRLEIRTTRQTPAGPALRSLVIDAGTGWVLQQHLFDAQGRMIAKSVASRHRRDPLSGVVMPRVVKLDFPTANPPFSMRIDLGNLQINRPLEGDPNQLWAMPCYQGFPPVDLCQPCVPPAMSPPTVTSAQGPSGWRASASY